MLDWKDAVVLLTNDDPDDSSFGTGFVFHKDSTGRRFLLTCLHVVDVLEKGRKRAPEGTLSILANGLPAEVWVRGNEILDLAVLAVDGLSAPPLPMGRPSERGAPFETAGFTVLEPKVGSVVPRPLSGALRDNNPVSSLRRPGRPRAWYWDVEIDPDHFRELTEGYSGAPVWDPASATVVGIMNLKRPRPTLGHALCVRSCDLLDPPLSRALPEYPLVGEVPPKRSRRRQSAAPGLPPPAIQEGAFQWLASIIDHTHQIERVASCLERGRDAAVPGRYFHAFEACLSDCPSTLAEHLAAQFGGWDEGVPGTDTLVTEPPLTRFGADGLWKALVDQLAAPGMVELTSADEQRLLLDWINERHLRVVYAQLDLAEHRARISEFIGGAIAGFGALRGIRRDARVLFLFGCIYKERGWLRGRRLRRPVPLHRITGCEHLGLLRKLRQNDVDLWSRQLRARPEPIDIGSLQRALDPLFPSDAVELCYRDVRRAALDALADAANTDQSRETL